MSWVKTLLGIDEPKKKAKAKPKGFFSVEVPINARQQRARKGEYLKMAKKSFQRTHADFVAVNAAGQKIQGAPEMKFGMDNSIQEQKALNAGAIDNITPIQFGWYAGQGFIGFQNCAMLAQHWFIDKACAMPALDAMRNGWDTTVNDGTDVDEKVIDAMRNFDKDLKIKDELIEWMHMGRVFGIRIAIPIIEFSTTAAADEFYMNPFNIDAVQPGAYQGWTQIDPYWITPELDITSASNPFDKHFYEPTWWRVNGKRYHRSHLMIFRCSRVADILLPTYLYGSPSIPQQIAARLYNAEMTADEAPLLAASKRMTVMNVDITQASANPEMFAQRMNEWADLRDNYGIKVVGEAEKIEQFDTSLTDFDAIIMTQFQLACAIARVPATKMLGTTPKGFNATGEYDESSYHEELESLQENKAAKFIERHNQLTIKSFVMEKFSTEYFKTTVVFKPTDSPTAEEIAQLNKTKAETDLVLVNAGSIDSFDARQRLSNDPESGYNGIPDVVPDGPGDRAAEQAAAQTEQAALEAAVNAPAKAKPSGGSGGES